MREKILWIYEYIVLIRMYNNYSLVNYSLQAEFQNVIDSVSRFGKPSCMSASIAWSPRRGESQQSSFVLGYNSDLSQFNSPKVCWVIPCIRLSTTLFLYGPIIVF